MKASEILIKYRNERKSKNFDDIHKAYHDDVRALMDKHSFKNYLSKPLLILAALLIIPIVIMAIADEDYSGNIFLTVLAIIGLLILSAVINWVIEEINYKRWDSRKYWKELREINWKYYEEYGSVVGFYDSKVFCCGDYDEHREQAYCSLTGDPISYTKYCNCKRRGAFHSSECCSKYLDTL